MDKFLSISELIASIQVEDWYEDEYKDYLDSAETNAEEEAREDMAGRGIYAARVRNHCYY